VREAICSIEDSAGPQQDDAWPVPAEVSEGAQQDLPSTVSRETGDGPQQDDAWLTSESGPPALAICPYLSRTASLISSLSFIPFFLLWSCGLSYYYSRTIEYFIQKKQAFSTLTLPNVP
jgi:hypothetical protein